MWEICSKSTVKALALLWCLGKDEFCSGVASVDFKQVNTGWIESLRRIMYEEYKGLLKTKSHQNYDSP